MQKPGDGAFHAQAAMGVCQRALQIADVGSAYGRVGAQLNGSAGYERARRHDDGILIARHIPRLGNRFGIDRRTHLDGLTEGDQFIRVVKADGLDDVVSRCVPGGIDGKPQKLKGARGKNGALDRLGDGVRREEEPLIEGLITASIGTDFRADARRRQAARCV